MNRWSKNGVLERVFEQLQRAQIVRLKLEAVALDSTIVKVHPDGTGALKKKGIIYKSPRFSAIRHTLIASHETTEFRPNLSVLQPGKRQLPVAEHRKVFPNRSMGLAPGPGPGPGDPPNLDGTHDRSG